MIPSGVKSGYDQKYGEVTVERGQLTAAEPVFVLRAQDELAAATVLHYANLRQDSGDKAGAEAIRRVALAMKKWPVKKKPD